MALFDTLTTPLKKMQAAYLRDVSRNCYPAKHMSEDFPNAEQVNLCKEEKRSKHFGKFEDVLFNHRDSTQFRFQECQVDAGNDLEKSVYCVRAYIQGIKDDNVKIISFTKENFAKHF